MSSNSKNEIFETSDEDTLKYKEILIANGISDEVSEVIIKSAGLQGEGFASQTKYVTINFENPDIKPLHLFVKILTSNASHQEFLSETKLYEKESRFFMEYVPAAKEFCKSKGYEGLVDMYPTCFNGDNDMVVLENLVVGKGYVLLNKHEMQDLEASNFLLENTNNHSLPFLNILVTRKEDGSFGHQIYRKPTHSDKYLHFTSAHPLCHKISAIDSLHYRALKLSDAENLKDELNHIKQTFIANGYPGYMVDASLQKMKIRVDSPPQSTDSQSKGRLILPWFNNTSNRIGGVIREELNVDIGYIPGRKISSFLCNTKDKRPKAEVGVYKIPCKENCQDIYVGETSRSLKIRVKEHQKDVEQAKTEESAVAGHVFEKEHHVDFGNASLVERETRTYNRLFKEGLYIRKAPNVMNRNNGMEIHEDWLDLLLPLTKTP